MALYRTQLLLEEGQHAELERLARESGRSMSELVRDVLDDYLIRTSEDESTRRSLAAIDGLAAMRERIQLQHGGLSPAMLDELREERDAELSA